jgi:uncharacterized protein (TIGR02118 family)
MKKKVKVIALLKTKPGMSQEDLKEYYFKKHAPIDLKFKNLKGYSFSLVDLTSQNENTYNGVAELYWDSIEEMNEDFESEAGKEGGADAASFTSEIVSLTTEEFVIKRPE